MKKILSFASILMLVTALAPLKADDTSGSSTGPTADETTALITLKTSLASAPKGSVYTTEAGRRQAMEMLRPYMPQFKGPRGGKGGRRGPRTERGPEQPDNNPPSSSDSAGSGDTND